MSSGQAGISAIREAAWLGRDRILGYAKVACIGYLPGLFVIFQIAVGARRVEGQALGVDFMALWSAATLAMQSGGAAAYDLGAQEAFQSAAFGLDGRYYPFFYPPPVLALAIPFAGLPFPWALAAWMVAGYLAYLVLARRLLPAAVWPIAAYPGAFSNLAHAQIGGLTSGLYLAAAQCFQRRPFVAGLLLGGLVCKPHLALLVPVALAAGRCWRAFAGAAVGSLGLIALTLPLVGLDGFQAFLETLAASRWIVLAEPDLLWKMPGIFAAARPGLGEPAAYGIQAVAALVMAFVVWRAWARSDDVLGRFAILTTATVLATPYLVDYDLIILIAPICWLAREALASRWRPWEKAILTAAYLLPMTGRFVTQALGANLSPVVLLLFLWILLRRLDAGRAAA